MPIDKIYLKLFVLRRRCDLFWDKPYDKGVLKEDGGKGLIGTETKARARG